MKNIKTSTEISEYIIQLFLPVKFLLIPLQGPNRNKSERHQDHNEYRPLNAAPKYLVDPFHSSKEIQLVLLLSVLNLVVTQITSDLRLTRPYIPPYNFPMCIRHILGIAKRFFFVTDQTFQFPFICHVACSESSELTTCDLPLRFGVSKIRAVDDT